MSLIVKNLSKQLGTPPQDILKDVSFEIENGEFVALRGRSGSGKSTLLYIASTLDNPTSGEVLIDGTALRDFGQKSLHEFRNQKIGFVFQFHYLLPELTALENVLMPARKLGLEKEKRARAIELLNLFDLENRHHHRPRELSGGQNQRVAIARALLMSPRFVFADEPTGNLDSANSERVFEILNDVNRTLGTTIVMVTHDDELSRNAHRVIELKDGRVVSDERIRQAPPKNR